jgi:hypothetical protein
MMTQIFKLTLALLLFFYIFALVFGVLDEGIRAGLYFAVLGIGSLFFPVLIFVTLYKFLLNKRLNYPNLFLRFLAKRLSLIAISFIGLFVWAMLAFMVTAGFKLDLHLILKDYREEYMNCMPVAKILALLIPVGHHLFMPNSQKNAI